LTHAAETVLWLIQVGALRAGPTLKFIFGFFGAIRILVLLLLFLQFLRLLLLFIAGARLVLVVLLVSWSFGLLL